MCDLSIVHFTFNKYEYIPVVDARGRVVIVVYIDSLSLTTVASNDNRDFEMFHMRKISFYKNVGSSKSTEGHLAALVA